MNEAEKLINSLYGKGTIGFTCDSCGREVNGCSIVNGMKFCAKCYQETFGKDNQQNEIQQLKQQLEEKDKLLKYYQEEEKLIAEILGDKDLTLIGSRKHLENLVVELRNKIKDRDIIIKELDKKLANFDNFMKGNKFETIEDLQNALNGKFIEVFDEKNKIWQAVVKNLTKTEQDRDTWQKACEMMGEELDLYATKEDDTISTAQYFYQQAKKEGENETNISGQN